MILCHLREHNGIPGLRQFRLSLERIFNKMKSKESQKSIIESIKRIEDSVHRSLFENITFLSQIDFKFLLQDQHLISTITVHWLSFVKSFDCIQYQTEILSDEYRNPHNRAIRILDLLCNNEVTISMFLKNLELLPESAKLVKDLKQKWSFKE